MTGAAMEIRTASHQQIELRGEPSVLSLGLWIVIGMTRLERIEASGCERRNQGVAAGEPRMRERCNSASVVQEAHGADGRNPSAGDERRTAEFEKAIESLIPRSHVARAHQRVGDLRPANALAALRGSEDGLGIDGTPEQRQPLADFGDAAQAVVALTAEKSEQLW